jgi:hypothetical protein
MSQYTPLGVKPLVTPTNTVPVNIKQPKSTNALTKAQLDALKKSELLKLNKKPIQPVDNSTTAGIMEQYRPPAIPNLVAPINTVPVNIKQPKSTNALLDAQLKATNEGKMINLSPPPVLQPSGAGAGAGTGTQVVSPISPSDDAQAKLLEAEKQKIISDLGIVKNQALAQIGQQQAAIAPQFDAQRAQASTQSMQQARNFAEYLAARGQSTSGIAAQSELSRGSGLTRQLGNIGQQQQAATQDVATRKSIIEQDYLGKIANATTQVELEKLKKEYTDAIKAEERKYQEGITASNRAYQERIDKENKAYRESQIASQEPKYNYLTDPNFSELYSNFANSQVINSEGGLTALTPQEILDSVIADRINYETRFGKAGYNSLLSLARSKV